MILPLWLHQVCILLWWFRPNPRFLQCQCRMIEVKKVEDKFICLYFTIPQDDELELVDDNGSVMYIHHMTQIVRKLIYLRIHATLKTAKH